MSYMAQKADDQIEAGLHERNDMIEKIETLKRENSLLKQDLQSLRSELNIYRKASNTHLENKEHENTEFKSEIKRLNDKYNFQILVKKNDAIGKELSLKEFERKQACIQIEEIKADYTAVCAERDDYRGVIKCIKFEVGTSTLTHKIASEVLNKYK